MRAYDFLEEQVQLNELKEYLDMNYYGSWIHPNGSIDGVNIHADWLQDQFGDFDAYGKAYNQGFVKVTHPESFGNVLGLRGKVKSIKKVFKIWWPTAIVSDKVIIEDADNSDRYHYYDYNMPDDKNKLQQYFGSQQRNGVEEK